jgi:hypothetical protein
MTRPPAWCKQVARYRGLRNAETEHEKLAVNPGSTQRKFSRAIVRLDWISLETLGLPARQRPRDRYLHIGDQPSERQRKTVSGWTMNRLSRQWGHKARNHIQNRRAQKAKTRATSFAPLQPRRFDGATLSIPTAVLRGFGFASRDRDLSCCQLRHKSRLPPSL